MVIAVSASIMVVGTVGVSAKDTSIKKTAASRETTEAGTEKERTKYQAERTQHRMPGNGRTDRQNTGTDGIAQQEVQPDIRKPRQGHHHQGLAQRMDNKPRGTEKPHTATEGFLDQYERQD